VRHQPFAPLDYKVGIKYERLPYYGPYCIFSTLEDAIFFSTLSPKVIIYRCSYIPSIESGVYMPNGRSETGEYIKRMAPGTVFADSFTLLEEVFFYASC